MDKKWLSKCECKWNQKYKSYAYEYGLKEYPLHELCFCSASNGEELGNKVNTFQEENRLIKELGEFK